MRIRPADDRRYDDAPYQSQDIFTNLQMDIAPTSGAGPSRQISLRVVGLAESLVNMDAPV